MSRRLDRPTNPNFVRMELGADAEMPAVEDAAHACRLSLASFCRLAIKMLATNQRVTLDEVRKEADRQLAKDDHKPKGKAK